MGQPVAFSRRQPNQERAQKFYAELFGWQSAPTRPWADTPWLIRVRAREPSAAAWGVVGAGRRWGQDLMRVDDLETFEPGRAARRHARHAADGTARRLRHDCDRRRTGRKPCRPLGLMIQCAADRRMAGSVTRPRTRRCGAGQAAPRGHPAARGARRLAAGVAAAFNVTRTASASTSPCSGTRGCSPSAGRHAAPVRPGRKGWPAWRSPGRYVGRSLDLARRLVEAERGISDDTGAADVG